MPLIDKQVILKCQDYGFECNFEIEGSTEFAVKEFSQHCYESHGIEYEIEVLGHFIRRKYR